MKIHKKLIRIFFAVLIVLSTVSGALLVRPSVVSAEEAVTPRDRATVWNAARAIGACVSGNGITGAGNGEETDRIKSGDFIHSGNLNINAGVIVNTDSGVIDCENPEQIKALFDLTTLNILDVLVGAGIYKQDAQDANKHKLVDESAPNSTVAQKIYDYVQRETGVDPEANLSDASKYITLKFAFDYQCKVVQYDSRNEDGSGAQDVIVVNDQGESETQYWSVRNPGAGNVGPGLPSPPAQDGTMDCQDIRIAINDTANDYAERLRALIAQGVDTSTAASITGNVGGDEGDDDQLSCEEAVNVSYAWAACPALNFLEGTVNFFFNFADSLLTVQAQSLYDNPELRAAWGYFRVIATALLIVIGLVMIFSQAIGGNN